MEREKILFFSILFSREGNRGFGFNILFRKGNYNKTKIKRFIKIKSISSHWRGKDGEKNPYPFKVLSQFLKMEIDKIFEHPRMLRIIKDAIREGKKDKKYALKIYIRDKIIEELGKGVSTEDIKTFCLEHNLGNYKKQKKKKRGRKKKSEIKKKIVNELAELTPKNLE